MYIKKLLHPLQYAFVLHIAAKTNKKAFLMSLLLSVFYTRVIINGILHYTLGAVLHTAFKLHIINMP